MSIEIAYVIDDNGRLIGDEGMRRWSALIVRAACDTAERNGDTGGPSKVAARINEGSAVAWLAVYGAADCDVLPRYYGYFVHCGQLLAIMGGTKDRAAAIEVVSGATRIRMGAATEFTEQGPLVAPVDPTPPDDRLVCDFAGADEMLYGYERAVRTGVGDGTLRIAAGVEPLCFGSLTGPAVPQVPASA